MVERLKQRGVSPERLGALNAPAGMDIGAVSPDEIAVSILAEIIQHRRSAKPPADEPRTPTEAIDPICGMTVEIATAEHRSETAGGMVYFCCRHCKTSFDRNLATRS
jgi:xanthine dehydrogenase accessory factor